MKHIFIRVHYIIIIQIQQEGGGLVAYSSPPPRQWTRGPDSEIGGPFHSASSRSAGREESSAKNGGTFKERSVAGLPFSVGQ